MKTQINFTRSTNYQTNNALVTVKTVALLLLLVSYQPIQAAQKKLPSGDEIAARINQRDEGIAMSRNLKMVLTDRRGKKRIRKTRNIRQYFGKEKRSVIFYLTPKNVKDTAFMTYDYPDEKRDDDQWLYLPAMRKVRRISASDRGDYFLGTDLSYEDIKLENRVSIKDYVRKTMGEDKINGHHCYVVQAIPVNKKIAKELGYGKVEQCVDSKIWMVRRSKIWDIRGNLLKTVTISEIHKVQGIWSNHRIDVENHKTGHNTLFIFSLIRYQDKTNRKLFTQQALRRGL